jgi:hypothetical protein
MNNLESIGRFLAIYGAISMALWFANMNLVIFIWMDLAGDVIGWVIRIVMVLAGAGMWIAGRFLVK